MANMLVLRCQSNPTSSAGDAAVGSVWHASNAPSSEKAEPTNAPTAADAALALASAAALAAVVLAAASAASASGV